MKRFERFLLVPILCAFASACLAQAAYDHPAAALPSLLEHPDVVALRDDPEGHTAKLRAQPASNHYSGDELMIMLYGLSIKGSGGGGGFIDGFEILNRIDWKRGIDIYDISTAADDKLYMVVGGLGAPSALKENLDGLIKAIERTMAKLAELKGMQVGGILSVESGPVNSMLAILLSQSLNVPLIDVDGAGRSVPSLTNLTYAYESYPIAPVVAGSALNPSQDLIVAYPTDAADAENQLRDIAAQLGGLIGISLWGQTGAELKASSVIRDAFAEAYVLGVFTVLAAEDPNWLARYFQGTGNYIGSYAGQLTRFQIDSSGGFDKVYLDITQPTAIYTINAENEDLLLQQVKPQPTTVVTAPHIIGYVVQDGSSFLPYNNGDVDMLKKAAAMKAPIYAIAAQSSPRLYDFSQSFLDIIEQVFGYTGPVVPPYRPTEMAASD